jgi:hypothetical protein
MLANKKMKMSEQTTANSVFKRCDNSEKISQEKIPGELFENTWGFLFCLLKINVNILVWEDF